jgi:hypothetical protein
VSSAPRDPDEKQLWRSQRVVISELLYDEWDPIGMKAFNGPVQEYATYADVAAAMARNGANVDEIAEYLTDIARNHIGMIRFEHETSLMVAEKIIRIIQDQG